MKPKSMKLLLIALLFTLMGGEWVQAQNFDNLSRKQRNQRIDELYYFDVNDMSISTDSAQLIKQELEYYGQWLQNRKIKRTWWSCGVMMVSAVVAGVGFGSDAPVVGAIGAVGCVGGFVYMIIAIVSTKDRKLLDKSRLMVDASIPVYQTDHLALGMSVFHNNMDGSNLLGPSVSLSF